MKRTRVNPRSARNKNEAVIRKEIREAAVPARCTIGPVLEELGVAGGCAGRGRVEGLHERRKASSGGSKVNPENLMPACNRCNGIVEDCHGVERRLIEDDPQARLVVRPKHGDLFESLSKRHDRFLTE